MIKISLDEGYIFDILSIYELKINKSDTIEKKNQNIENYSNLKSEIVDQIGIGLFDTIIESEEYKKLYTANSDTFDVVDKAKTDEVLASMVDKCNHVRYICKQNIQVKFFNKKLSETKIGYEKLKLWEL
jgi:hypothetical protein